MRVLATAVAVLVLLAGCTTTTPSGTEDDSSGRTTGGDADGKASSWPIASHDLSGSRHAPAAGIASGDIGRLGLDWRFDTFGAVTGTPTVRDGLVYAATWRGMVYAIDAQTGAEEWSVDIGAQVDATVALWDRYAYVGDATGRLTALNATDGDTLWTVTIDETASAHLYATPIVWEGPDGPLLIQGVASDQESIRIHGDLPVDFRGKIVALDARTGEEHWRTFTVPVGHTGAPVWGGLVVGGDPPRLLFGTGNAYTEPAAQTTDAIMALDPRDGAVLWSHQATPDDVFTQALPVSPDHDFGSTPSLLDHDGRLLVGIGQKSSVYWTLDVQTGEVVWTHGTPGPGEGIIGDSGTADGTVVVNQATHKKTLGLDAATGLLQWEQDASGIMLGGPAITAGAAFVGDASGRIAAYALDDGTVLWETTTGDAGGVHGSLSAAAGRIFVPTVTDGYLGEKGAVLAFAPGGAAPVEQGGQAWDGRIKLEDFAFQPARIAVPVGTTVTWVNGDGLYHTATSGWDNGTTFDFALPAGAEASWTFEEPGTYEIVCTPHAYWYGTWQGMVAEVVVEGG